jgi:hypothetical protein
VRRVGLKVGCLRDETIARGEQAKEREERGGGPVRYPWRLKLAEEQVC